MKVLYLDHCAELSGAEIALCRLIVALRDDVESYVVLGEDGPLVARLESAGAHVEVVELPRKVAGVSRTQVNVRLDPRALVRAALYSSRLVPVMRRIAPDLVHTNSLKAAFYGALAARLARLPVVWHVRDQILPSYMSGTAVRIVRAAARTLPTAVVSPSQSTLDTVPGARRGQVVTSALPLPDTFPARAPYDGPLRIIFLGRLAQWKGQDLFLEAFATAFPNNGAVARIVGEAMFSDAEYAAQLEGQAARLGVSDRVEFRGFRDDIWSELADSDVLVHFSRTPEPFGQVVIEGLASGVAVIAANAGGPAEVLTDGQDGLLVRPGDTRALSKAMLRLVDAELRDRLSAAGRVTAARYSPDRAAASLLSVYRSLIRPRTR